MGAASPPGGARLRNLPQSRARLGTGSPPWCILAGEVLAGLPRAASSSLAPLSCLPTLRPLSQGAPHRTGASRALARTRAERAGWPALSPCSPRRRLLCFASRVACCQPRARRSCNPPCPLRRRTPFRLALHTDHTAHTALHTLPCTHCTHCTARPALQTLHTLPCTHGTDLPVTPPLRLVTLTRSVARTHWLPRSFRTLGAFADALAQHSSQLQYRCSWEHRFSEGGDVECLSDATVLPGVLPWGQSPLMGGRHAPHEAQPWGMMRGWLGASWRSSSLRSDLSRASHSLFPTWYRLRDFRQPAVSFRKH
jgi:hypothetical protein